MTATATKGYTLRTERHTDLDGLPSKAIVLTGEDGENIRIALGTQHARELSAALRPNGRDITFPR